MRLDWKHFLDYTPFSLNTVQQQQLQQLHALLVEWNKLHNLTRLTTLHDFLTGHLLDSFQLVSCIQTYNPQNILDIGAGAGFPSIPLAIAFPHIQITAMDATQKKTRFIEYVQQTLKLDNLYIITGRAEEVAHQPAYREQYDLVTARAVAALPVLLELAVAYIQTGGHLVAMKTTHSLETELLMEPPVFDAIGLSSNVHVCDVSIEGLLPERCLVKVQKIKTTPVLYPRKMSLIKKKPLF